MKFRDIHGIIIILNVLTTFLSLSLSIQILKRSKNTNLLLHDDNSQTISTKTRRIILKKKSILDGSYFLLKIKTNREIWRSYKDVKKKNFFFTKTSKEVGRGLTLDGHYAKSFPKL